MSENNRYFCTCDSGKLIKCKDGNLVKYSDYSETIKSLENRIIQLEKTERSILELTHPNIRKFMLENESLTVKLSVMREVGLALVAKLEECHVSPNYHYINEFINFKQALKEAGE